LRVTFIEKSMAINKSTLVKRFFQAAKGKPTTQNIPLKGGYLVVSTRKLDNFQIQDLAKQGVISDNKRKINCLYIEGKIRIGNGKSGKEYYVQYTNYGNGYVDLEVIPNVTGHSTRLYVGGDANLSQKRFEEFIRRNILPLLK